MAISQAVDQIDFHNGYLHRTSPGDLCHQVGVLDALLLPGRVHATVPRHSDLEQDHRRTETLKRTPFGMVGAVR